jgi:cytoskeletal protein CcmA (bactofilin family)
MFNKIKPKNTQFNSIIDGIIIDGDITAEAGKSVFINSQVFGSIRCEKGNNSTIYIGKDGIISKKTNDLQESVDTNIYENNVTEVSADHIIVEGKIEAMKVHAYQSLLIKNSGEILAHTINYKTLTVETNGKIIGYLYNDRE